MSTSETHSTNTQTVWWRLDCAECDPLAVACAQASEVALSHAWDEDEGNE